MVDWGSDGSESFVLGIDVGTTSIKVSLLRNNTRDVVESFSCETGATFCAEDLDFAEQDVAKILSSLQHALGQLSTHFLSKVSSIGICGQMHGCVMWKGNSCVTWNISEFRDHFRPGDNVSHLITWEDRRCTSEFLATLPVTRTDVAISTGFGCASLFWLQRNHPNLLERFDSAGTIMDFIVCVLCQMDKPCMSVHNAVSWGYFHVDNMTWELDVLERGKFPTHLLPVVVKPDAVAGKLQRPFYNIPVGTPVGVGLGDFQCSVFASISQQSDAVLNIGTSCQLAVVVPDSVCVIDTGESPNLAKSVATEALQLLPFFKGTKVITAASLSGGNVFAVYVKMLTSWMKDLGVNDSLPSTDKIYQRILYYTEKKGSTSLKVVPTFWGERHIPDEKGQVTNVAPENISLGDIGVALSCGLAENVQKMMTKEFLQLYGVQRIVGTGSALIRNQVLQKQVEQVFGLPLVLHENVDASTGAALAVLCRGKLT